MKLAIRVPNPTALVTGVLLTAVSGVQFCEAQSQPTAQTVKFEVASVKPSALVGTSWSIGCASGPGGNIPVGRCQARNASLLKIIAQAYDIPAFSADQSISGAPGWVNTERYDIDAKAENPSASASELRQMLQNLLAERFHLKVHPETKEVGGYALVVAKSGLKNRPVVNRGPNSQPIPLAIGAGSIQGLIRSLSTRLSAPIVDKTNITGEHDFSITMELLNAPDPPSIFTVLEDEFGLKLEPQKVPLTVFVVDHVEKPTKN
jgi:uncharacterized protein (TIGR03435 family)